MSCSHLVAELRSSLVIGPYTTSCRTGTSLLAISAVLAIVIHRRQEHAGPTLPSASFLNCRVCHVHAFGGLDRLRATAAPAGRECPAECRTEWRMADLRRRL